MLRHILHTGVMYLEQKISNNWKAECIKIYKYLEKLVNIIYPQAACSKSNQNILEQLVNITSADTQSMLQWQISSK